MWPGLRPDRSVGLTALPQTQGRGEEEKEERGNERNREEGKGREGKNPQTKSSGYGSGRNVPWSS